MTTNPTIRPGEARDALALAPRLRPADADEFLANGRCPTAGLLRAVNLSSFVRCILAPDGRPISLFGFAPINHQTACPWLVGTDDLVTTHRAWFIRKSPEIVASGDPLWGHFFNRVHAANTVHVRWLRWSGFDVGEPEPFGPRGELFRTIYRVAHTRGTPREAAGGCA